MSIIGNSFNDCAIGCGGFDEVSTGSVICGNNFLRCGIGIQAGATAGMSVTGNSFAGEGSGIGVNVYVTSNITITGNTFFELDNVIKMARASYVNLNANNIKNCYEVLNWGVQPTNPEKRSQQCIIQDNIIIAEEGYNALLQIANSENIVVKDNILSGVNSGIEIDANSTNDIISEGNLVKGIIE